MSEAEPVQLTSLDESFDEAMKALLGGLDVRAVTTAKVGEPPAAAKLDRVFAYLRSTFGLTALGGEVPSAPAHTSGVGGWIRRLARRLFVSRTYHATLVTALGELAARQSASEQRLEALAAAQSLANERSARVLFRLWGDYNHLVRVVLNHHVNEVFQAFQRHFQAFEGHHTAFEKHFAAFEKHFHAFEGHHGAFEKNFQAFQDHFAQQAATVAELTEALRKLEHAVHQIEGPHDDLVRSVSELLAARVREEALARRLEALEDARRGGESPMPS